jgi:hypothetical protein
MKEIISPNDNKQSKFGVFKVGPGKYQLHHTEKLNMNIPVTRHGSSFMFTGELNNGVRFLVSHRTPVALYDPGTQKGPGRGYFKTQMKYGQTTDRYIKRFTGDAEPFIMDGEIIKLYIENEGA